MPRRVVPRGEEPTGRASLARGRQLDARHSSRQPEPSTRGPGLHPSTLACSGHGGRSSTRGPGLHPWATGGLVLGLDAFQGLHKRILGPKDGAALVVNAGSRAPGFIRETDDEEIDR